MLGNHFLRDFLIAVLAGIIANTVFSLLVEFLR